jgi:DNA-directed RNA polymerase specialized sigma subunit
MNVRDLFTVTHETPTLTEEAEITLIVKAQLGDKESQWALLLQYRGVLKKSVSDVLEHARARSTYVPADQLDDLRSQLVLTTLEAVASFDAVIYKRLAQVLPRALARVVTARTTSLTVPARTRERFLSIVKEAYDRDVDPAALAPEFGMSVATYRAISNAIEARDIDDETVTATWDASPSRPPADPADEILAREALSILTDHERQVVELSYGYPRGEPKPDLQVGKILLMSTASVTSIRTKALTRMRRHLNAQ